MIKAIIFDFGRVIANFNNDIFIQNLASYTPKKSSELNRIIYEESDLPKKYETGLISSHEFFKKIKGLTNADISEQKFSEIYSHIFTPIPSTIGLIGDLKAQDYKIGLLSNTSEGDYQFGLKPIFQRANINFDSESLSFKVGSMKPNQEIYKDILRKLDVSAQQAIYIDDIQEYVEVANEIGMKGIHYKNHEDLVQKLGNLGIKL